MQTDNNTLHLITFGQTISYSREDYATINDVIYSHNNNDVMLTSNVQHTPHLDHISGQLTSTGDLTKKNIIIVSITVTMLVRVKFHRPIQKWLVPVSGHEPGLRPTFGVV